MTQTTNWAELAILSIRDPKAAAQMIVSWQLPRDVLWTALACVAAINTIMFSLSDMLSPSQTPLPAILHSPFAFFVIVAGGLVVTVNAIYWTARMLGAKGDLGDMLALMIWLQALRAVAQAAVLVLMLVAPALAALLVFATAVLALWLLLNFISVGMRIESIGKSALVLIASSIAVVVGLSLLLSMIGLSALGFPANV